MLVWRRNRWCLEIVFFIVLSLSSVSAVRINEVMPNPTLGYDEWVEIYNPSNQILDLSEWMMEISGENSSSNTSLSCEGVQNCSLLINESYFIVIGKKANISAITNISIFYFNAKDISNYFLPNEGRVIRVYNKSSKVDEVAYPDFSPASKKGKSYSLLSDTSWIICNEPTPGFENSCQTQNQTQTNQTSNTAQNQTQTRIYLKLEYEEEVENNKEIEVEVKAYNLNGSYDAKVYLTFKDNETIISETYDKEEKKWKSSSYYVAGFFDCVGNESANLRLRLKKEYENFTGGALIKARIRENGKSNIIGEFSNEIVIIKKDEINEERNDVHMAEGTSNVVEIENTNVIKLNKKDIKSQNTDEIWKSKTQYIKEYSIYGFALFCVLVIVSLIINGEKWLKK